MLSHTGTRSFAVGRLLCLRQPQYTIRPSYQQSTHQNIENILSSYNIGTIKELEIIILQIEKFLLKFDKEKITLLKKEKINLIKERKRQIPQPW
jgi:hypothetical protein